MPIQPLIAIGIALTVAMYGQTTSEAPKTGSIQGLVVNSKTGEPIRRVNLTLRPLGVPGIGGGGGGSRTTVAPAGNPADNSPYAASTAADGKFRFDKVEPGRYYLGAERQGFIRASY